MTDRYISLRMSATDSRMTSGHIGQRMRGNGLKDGKPGKLASFTVVVPFAIIR